MMSHRFYMKSEYYEVDAQAFFDVVMFIIFMFEFVFFQSVELRLC